MSTPQTPQPEHASRASPGVTLRAVLLGLVLIPLNCYWVIVVEVRWYTLDGSCLPLFVTPVFMLALVTVGNILVGKLAPRRALRQGELLTVYIMLVMSVTMAGHDTLQNMFGHITHYAWYTYQHPDLKWPQTFGALLPRHLQVMDVEALRGFYEGHSTMYRWANLRPWLAPLAWWSAFVLVMVMMMLCLSVLFRRAWTEHEKLSFPIIQLPLALTERGAATSFFRSRLMWMGFALAAAIGILNGLHMFRPTLPFLNVRYDETRIEFRTWPWNAGGNLPMSFYPFAVGLAYFLPLDLSFSCWFFYLFMRAERLIGHLLGYDAVPDFPFVTEQGIGAWYAYGFFLLLITRKYLHNAVRVALRPIGDADAAEPMRYRTAFWGLIVGMAVFVIFWRAAGMSLGWAIVVLVTYFLLALSITRVRAEAGGQHTVWDLEPRNLFRLFGSRAVGPKNLAAAAVSHWYWRLNRSHPMPSQLEAFKLAHEHGMNLRGLVAPMLAAMVVATFCGMWACLHVFYTDGAAAKCRGFGNWTGIESFNWLGSAINQGFPAEPRRWAAVAAAAGFVAALSALHARFPWWPFHPLGYAIGPGLIWLWMPFLIAWFIKFFVLRYGGLRLYRRALPLFLGLVLGDYVMGAIWALIGVFRHIPTYQIFH